MARAIIWAHLRKPQEGGKFLIVNTGSNEWNYQIKELAEQIHHILPEIKVSINKNAQPDKRSYKVSFDMFKKLAPGLQPEYNLETTIKELIEGLESIGFKDKDFRKSRLMRLNVINELIDSGILDSNLNLLKK